MSGSPRVFELLEEILNSGKSPEEVCVDCPELLPDVRRRWQSFRLIDEQIAGFFPDESTRQDLACARPTHSGKLPEIPGYRVDGVLGSGGMGIVYNAWQLRLDRPVALKMLLTGAQARPTEVQRFLREAQAVAALHHPNIVQVYDVGEVDGRPYFTMEFVDGGDLGEKIEGTPQPSHESAELVATLAEAIHVANQSGIVHRDLKPANVLLSADGIPKITDFGLARRLEGEAHLTLSGTPLGTPSYMAPEQARGDKSSLGPATDVYALGAILYELLTGRPPFRAETPTKTVQQLLSDEPVPPTRLNPQAPRDLETICLKCLEKEPHKRYPSAAALADDLRRFGRGESIAARPLGKMARLVRWGRRRPTAAALYVVLMATAALALALVGGGLWWYGQNTALEAAAVAYAEADLSESERLLDRGELKSSAAVLQRSRDRLRDFVPPELAYRLAKSVENLELVAQLDNIRQERALVKPPNEIVAALVLPMPVPRDHDTPANGNNPGHRYFELFIKAGIGGPGDDPREVAERVRVSPARSALLAALDDWAACGGDRDQISWVLQVVRQADPDPWRDRVRDPRTWNNAEALRELAARAPVAEQSPQLLAVLGARLRATNVNAVPFLARVVSRYPADFWVNVEMGNALSHQQNLIEAIGYYRAALALRPQTVSLRYALGGAYLGLQRWDQAIVEYEQAIGLEPQNPWCHNRLGFTLAWKGGREDEAIAQFREAIRLDPRNGWSHYFLGIALENKGCLDEAVEEFQAAVRSREKPVDAKQRLRGLLLKMGRKEEARSFWKQDLATQPADHDAWFGYAELCLFVGDRAEYRCARRDLLAQFGKTTDRIVAERVGRACLLLPAPEDELQCAVALTERAVAGGPSGQEIGYPYYQFSQGLARYRQGRYDDAIAQLRGAAAEVMGPCPKLITAMSLWQKRQKDEAQKAFAAAVASYDWRAMAIDPHAWIAHILRGEAEALIVADTPGAWKNQ